VAAGGRAAPLSPRKVHGYRDRTSVFRCVRLLNGLHAVAERDGPPTGVVSVEARYGVGASAERAGQLGWLHLLEHVCSRRLRSSLSALGASTLAETTSDAVRFSTTAPVQALDQVLAAEAERMSVWDLDEDVVLSERVIVAREIEWAAVASAHEATVVELVRQVAPWVDHSPRGVPDDVNALSASTLANLHRFVLRPELAVVAVAGDVPPDVEDALWRHFGALDSAPATWPPASPALEATAPATHTGLAWALADGHVAAADARAAAALVARAADEAGIALSSCDVHWWDGGGALAVTFTEGGEAAEALLTALRQAPRRLRDECGRDAALAAAGELEQSAARARAAALAVAAGHEQTAWLDSGPGPDWDALLEQPPVRSGC
jgi:hypothetical protein